MKINSKILEVLKANNNMVTTSQVIEKGYSRAVLTKYVKEGLLKRYRQGTYMLPEAIHDDMYTLMLRSENIIFSHGTALFLNGFSERMPFIHSVTIPSDRVLPASLKDECICYYIKPELHGMGLIWKETTFGNMVRCYDAERTICDLLRSRNRCDEETVISAMKNYVEYKEKDLNRLANYAEQFRIRKVLKRYMEVLL